MASLGLAPGITAVEPNLPVAPLFIDLDNLKQISDALGHVVGDQALRLAARRLAASHGADPR